MIDRKAAFPSSRATALGLVTALALTAIAPTVASAASAGKGFTAATGSMTDISSRRRGFNPGAAAGAAAVAGIVGLGVAAAAANSGYYDDSYAYYGDPAPVYVAPGPYYGGYGYGGYGYRSGRPLDQNGHPNAGW